MSGYYYFLFILPLFITNCQNIDKDPFTRGVDNLSIKEKGFFENDRTDSMHVMTVGEIETDSSGNVYVFDEAMMNIKVFTNNGRPKDIIGGRGRGPGEFISNSGFSIYRDSIYVFDKDLQRINIFTLGGEFIDSRVLKIAAPAILKPLGDRKHLGIHSDFRQEISKRRFSRVYSSTFSEVGNPFLQLTELDQNLEGVIEIMSILLGSVQVLDRNEFIFVPYIYDGKLYKFEKNKSDQWENSIIYTGKTDLPSYASLKNTANRYPDIHFSSVNTNAPVELVLYNQSRGLLKHENKIYHFTHCEFDDKENNRVFGVEIYNSNMEALGYVPIKSIPISNEPGNGIGWFAEAIDSNGNVYIRAKSREKSSIRVLFFQWEE